MLSETSSETTTRSESGNEITTAVTSTLTASNNYALSRDETYDSGSDTKTVTASGSRTVTETANALTGTYSLDSSGAETTAVNESGDRGHSYTLSSGGSHTFSNTDSGNSVTGAYSLSGSTADTGSLTKTGTISVGVDFSIDVVSSNTSDSTTTGNRITGSYASSGSSSDSLTTSEQSNHAAGSYSLTDTDTATTTFSSSGNDITGVMSGSHSGTEDSSLVQTGSNTAGTFTLTATASDSPLVTRSGNTVTGEFTMTISGSQSHTLDQTNVSGADQYTLSAAGVKDYSRTTTLSSITGEASSSETGSDTYTLTQAGTHGTRDYTQTLTGTDDYTLTEANDQQAGGFDRTFTAIGTYTLVSEGTDGGTPFSDTTSACNVFGFTEVGNYVDANLVQMLTGDNRYELVEQFNNPSATDGAIAGTADFSPVGEALFTGQGAGPPTGGTSFGDGRAAADAFFAGYHGSFGSDAAEYVRGAEAYGPADFGSDYDLSGAATNAVYADLGRQHAYEYCFAAGTLVLMADGSSKPIEQIQPGELVLSVSDRAPEGPVEAQSVVEVYHNKPNRLLSVHLGDEVIRSTPNHPFFVQGKGWIHAAELSVGDRLRTHEGGWTEVTDLFDNGEVEPVFNLQVRGTHTYFVQAREDGAAVLVHNESRWYEFSAFGMDWTLNPFDEDAQGFTDTVKAYGTATDRATGQVGQVVLTGQTVDWEFASGSALAGAAGDGLQTGGKAVVNQSAKAGASFVSLGQWEAGDVITVTEQDLANGYDMSAAFARGGAELLLVATPTGVMAIASKAGKLQKVGQVTSAGLRAIDYGQNVVDVGSGLADMQENGVGLMNSVQVVAGGLGVAGDSTDALKQLRKAGYDIKIDTSTLSSGPVPLGGLRITKIDDAAKAKLQRIANKSHDVLDDVAGKQRTTTLSVHESGHVTATGSRKPSPPQREVLASEGITDVPSHGQATHAGGKKGHHGEQRGAKHGDNIGDPVVFQVSSSKAKHGGKACNDCGAMQDVRGIENGTGKQ